MQVQTIHDPQSPCAVILGRCLAGALGGVLSMAFSGCDQATPSASEQTAYGRVALRQTLEEGSSAATFNTETYDSIQETDFVDAWQQSRSTFAIDVDTASYANVRRMLNAGKRPPTGAVRIEEMVNYFSYAYPQPEGQHPFSVSTELASCPWNTEHQLLRIGLQGRKLEAGSRAACNLVFLLDVSGSMSAANKLPLVQSALKMLVQQLDERDRIAIVVYAGASGLALDSTSAAETVTILGALDKLQAGGPTNGGQGIDLAYRIAEQHRKVGGTNRVILCTDGDFNVGNTSESGLVDLIEEKAKSNIFLSVLGFGEGNLKDATMEKLADRGNGNYAYIDSLLEARKVLVEEIGGTLVTIAKDVKIQVDFNPLHVKSYRLIGYENRLLNNQDFRDDQRDAGEIGAGHSVTAFYEIVPAGEESTNGVPADNSEFVQPMLAPRGDRSTMLAVNLRYKMPEANDGQEFQVRVAAGTENTASSDFQFAAAVIAYGMLLRESQFAGATSWQWIIDTASVNLGDDPRGLRNEFVQLAKIAQRLDR